MTQLLPGNRAVNANDLPGRIYEMEEHPSAAVAANVNVPLPMSFFWR